MTSQTDKWMEKAGVLIEALPFMRRYGNKPIVVKFGGHAMGEQTHVDSFAADMTLLRQTGGAASGGTWGRAANWRYAEQAEN